MKTITLKEWKHAECDKRGVTMHKLNTLIYRRKTVKHPKAVRGETGRVRFLIVK